MRSLVVLMSATVLAFAPVQALAQAPGASPAKPDAQTAAAKSQPIDLRQKRKGWHVYSTKYAFPDLVKRLEESVKTHKMAVVNAASASDGAKAQGFTILGNRVVGVFRNDFARRMLTVSTAAGIEAPIRFYITEDPDGKATLSYRSPSSVFAPYVTRKAADLGVMAKELDAIFAQIALETVGG